MRRFRLIGLVSIAAALAVAVVAGDVEFRPPAWFSSSAVDTVDLKNGTNPQALNIYRTDDGAGNTEFGGLAWLFGSLQIQTSATGTGTYRGLYLNPGSGFTQSKSIMPVLDDTYTLGHTTPVQWQTLYLARGTQGAKVRALTESSATALVDIALAASTTAGGLLKYCVRASDASDFQNRCAEVRFSAVNKAGTTTCVLGPASPDETNDGNAGALSVGTLTYDVTCTDTTDSFSLDINAVSSLAQTTLEAEWRVDMLQIRAATPQT